MITREHLELNLHHTDKHSMEEKLYNITLVQHQFIKGTDIYMLKIQLLILKDVSARSKLSRERKEETNKQRRKKRQKKQIKLIITRTDTYSRVPMQL